MFNVGFIVSGKGDNIVLKHLIEKASVLEISLHIFCYENDCTGIQIGKEKNIPFTIVDKGKNNKELSANLFAKVQAFQPGVVFLLFNRLLTSEFLDKALFPVVNIHPSLLPSFTGFKAIDQAIEFGTKVMGVTAHLVDSSVDQGPVIIQSVIPVTDKMHSYSDVKPIISQHYILIATQVLCWFKDKKVELAGRKIKVINAEYKLSYFYPNIEAGIENLCL